MSASDRQDSTIQELIAALEATAAQLRAGAHPDVLLLRARALTPEEVAAHTAAGKPGNAEFHALVHAGDGWGNGVTPAEKAADVLETELLIDCTMVDKPPIVQNMAQLARNFRLALSVDTLEHGFLFMIDKTLHNGSPVAVAFKLDPESLEHLAMAVEMMKHAASQLPPAPASNSIH